MYADARPPCFSPKSLPTSNAWLEVPPHNWGAPIAINGPRGVTSPSSTNPLRKSWHPAIDKTAPRVHIASKRQAFEGRGAATVTCDEGVACLPRLRLPVPDLPLMAPDQKVLRRYAE